MNSKVIFIQLCYTKENINKIYLRREGIYMEYWKKNLGICCFACFIVSIGMSQMAPILPLYIAETGITNPADIARWSGIIFGANFISLAIASPIWGRLSDRYGRKPMALRASLWLGIIMIGMGLAQNVWQMTALRLIQGAMSGFLGAITPLIAQETPEDKSGWALGIFFTSQVSGALIGPLLGGWLSEMFSCRQTFFVVGGFCFLGFIATCFIHETFRLQPKAAALSLREVWASLPDSRLIFGLFITTFLMHFSLMSIQPIITVYIATLIPESDHIALTAGAVFSAAGIASALSASRIGHLSDRIGPQRVLLAALIVAGLVFLPQAFVRTPLELGTLRFILGLATAGLLPSINSLIRRSTPSFCMGRIYGLNQAAQFTGMFSGSVLGGWLAASIGIASVFLIPGVLLLINAGWFRFMSYRP